MQSTCSKLYSTQYTSRMGTATVKEEVGADTRIIVDDTCRRWSVISCNAISFIYLLFGRIKPSSIVVTVPNNDSCSNLNYIQSRDD